ncbi:hypothetical protein ES703_69583 [subsurface metagenome]
MSVEVRDVDLLIARYGWLLKDLRAVKVLVREWGLSVETELVRVGDMRAGLRRLMSSGTEEI